MNKYTCDLSATERAKLFVELYGQVFKYIWRMGKKEDNSALKDVSKAIWYANKLKELLDD